MVVGRRIILPYTFFTVSPLITSVSSCIAFSVIFVTSFKCISLVPEINMSWRTPDPILNVVDGMLYHNYFHILSHLF